MKGYYKKKTYTCNNSVSHVIRKKHFDRNVKFNERITYEVYWEVVAFHRKHKDITKLYVLQANPTWIEIELVIN